MAEKENWQKMLKERRLEHQLELQSRQIETVLSKHEVPAQVAGGYVQPRSIQFNFAPHIEAGLDRLRHIKQDLFTVLGVSDGDLVGDGDYWQLHIARPETPPVSLLDMLPMLADLPPLTLMLGMAENGRPLLVELSEHDLTNVLISGNQNAGKSALLRSLALSLALTYKQSQLQMSVIDGSTSGKSNGYSTLEPLSYLPHMLSPVAYVVEEFEETIAFLRDEMTYRREQQLRTPGIVVLVDEVTQLFSAVRDQQIDEMTQLIQRGAEVGIFVIMTTSQPDSKLISNTMRLKLPIRLVGKVENDHKAAMATEMTGTQAEYLLGKGDFLAVMDEDVTHFQAAYIGDYDLHLTLETLHRNRPQPLLAHSISNQQVVSAYSQPVTETAQEFDVTQSGVHVVPDETAVSFDELN